MAALSSFYPDIRIHHSGAPSLLLDFLLLRVAQDFCKRSTIDRKDLDAFDITEDVRSYTLTPATGKRIHAIIHAQFTGSNDEVNAITPANELVLDESHPLWRLTDQGVLYHYYLPEPHTFNLTWDPIETVTDSIELRVVYKPADGVTTLDDILYDDWVGQIAAGVVYRLLMMPGEDWYDPKRAAEFRSMYEDGVGEALKRAESSHTKNEHLVLSAGGVYS